jgi:hypothetical protein
MIHSALSVNFALAVFWTVLWLVAKVLVENGVVVSEITSLLLMVGLSLYAVDKVIARFDVIYAATTLVCIRGLGQRQVGKGHTSDNMVTLSHLLVALLSVTVVMKALSVRLRSSKLVVGEAKGGKRE